MTPNQILGVTKKTNPNNRICYLDLSKNVVYTHPLTPEPRWHDSSAYGHYGAGRRLLIMGSRAACGAEGTPACSNHALRSWIYISQIQQAFRA